MPVPCAATRPRSLCCTFKRDNIQTRPCLHVEGEGLSGNPYPKLQSQVQLPFAHTCMGFLLKWHKTCLKSCTEPNLACLWLHTKAMPFCSPPSTQWKQCCQVKVTAGVNVCSIIRRSQYSNAGFGICQVCICLHYL